jgi:hypothetical protein
MYLGICGLIILQAGDNFDKLDINRPESNIKGTVTNNLLINMWITCPSPWPSYTISPGKVSGKYILFIKNCG